MRVIAIGGEPGTGKSALVMSVMKSLGTHRNVELGTLKARHYVSANVMVLGVYDSKSSPGTDRLCHRVAAEWLLPFLEWARAEPKLAETIVLFEGDRLCADGVFSGLDDLSIPFVLRVLETSEPEKRRRYQARGSSQSITYRRGRATKYQNLLQRWGGECWQSESQSDMVANVQRLRALLIP